MRSSKTKKGSRQAHKRLDSDASAFAHASKLGAKVTEHVQTARGSRLNIVKDGKPYTLRVVA